MSVEHTDSAQPSTCPSAFALERYRLAPEGQPSELAAHIAQCARCTRYLEEAEGGEAMFRERTALRERVIALADNAPPPAAAATPWWKGWWGWVTEHPAGAFGGVVAVAAAIMLLLVWPFGADAPTHPNTLRTKGSLKLTLYSDVRPKGVALLPGAEVHPGERIRFGVALPEGGHVAVLGVDAVGEVFVYYPLEDMHTLEFHEASAPNVPTLLKGAIALDDILGTEWYVGLSCREALDVEYLTDALEDVAHARDGWKDEGLPLLMPDGCVQEAIFLEKIQIP